MPAAAIHTFLGYTFRSRVEFSWAQEFETLGLPWEYEPFTFRQGRESYTPDFGLCGRELYAEIKVDRARNLHNKFHLCIVPLLLIFGTPQHCYIRIKPAGVDTFLSARFASFALAYNIARKAAA